MKVLLFQEVEYQNPGRLESFLRINQIDFMLILRIVYLQLLDQQLVLHNVLQLMSNLQIVKRRNLQQELVLHVQLQLVVDNSLSRTFENLLVLTILVLDLETIIHRVNGELKEKNYQMIMEELGLRLVQICALCLVQRCKLQIYLCQIKIIRLHIIQI